MRLSDLLGLRHHVMKHACVWIFTPLAWLLHNEAQCPVICPHCFPFIICIMTGAGLPCMGRFSPNVQK